MKRETNTHLKIHFQIVEIRRIQYSVATNYFRTFWTNDRMSMRYTYFSCRELCLAIDFLIDDIYFRFGSSVFRQVTGIPMGTNSAPLLADLVLHTFEYDFMVKTMKQDITKAIQFSSTFRYIDDLFSVNNVDFGNYINAIYSSELQLTNTSTSSTEVLSRHKYQNGWYKHTFPYQHLR